jgi:GTP-binding protein
MPLPVKFLKSAVFAQDYPKADRPEVALAGRSNAGKSSFLNAFTQTKIAKVSQAPGKTRLLNFFDVGQHYRIVDMPGYGWASRSGDEMRTWTEMVETYLQTRENLVGLLLLMDLRRDWEEEEEMLCRFMASTSRPVFVVGTKSDRCSRQEIADRLKALKNQNGGLPTFSISSDKRVGLDELEDKFFRDWIRKPGPGGKK